MLTVSRHTQSNRCVSDSTWRRRNTIQLFFISCFCHHLIKENKLIYCYQNLQNIPTFLFFLLCQRDAGGCPNIPTILWERPGARHGAITGPRHGLVTGPQQVDLPRTWPRRFHMEVKKNISLMESIWGSLGWLASHYHQFIERVFILLDSDPSGKKTDKDLVLEMPLENYGSKSNRGGGALRCRKGLKS